MPHWLVTWAALNAANSRRTLESPEAPFASVYLVPTRARTSGGQAADGIDTVAKYLALETTPDARAVIRSCRAAHTPQEQSQGRSLAIKTLGVASLADERRELTNQLAIELSQTVKRHWITPDTSANWEQLWRDEKQAASEANLEAAGDGNQSAPVAVGQAERHDTLGAPQPVQRVHVTQLCQ